MDFSQTVVSFKKLWLWVWTRAKKQNEDIFKNKVAFPIFLAGNFKKLSLKNFEPEMRKNFKIFPKIPKKCHMIFKCGLREKLKWPFWIVFFVDLKQIMKKIFEQKIRHFLIMFGTFFKNFS
jgi:hypothetical protein